MNIYFRGRRVVLAKAYRFELFEATFALFWYNSLPTIVSSSMTSARLFRVHAIPEGYIFQCLPWTGYTAIQKVIMCVTVSYQFYASTSRGVSFPMSSFSAPAAAAAGGGSACVLLQHGPSHTPLSHTA